MLYSCICRFKFTISNDATHTYNRYKPFTTGYYNISSRSKRSLYIIYLYDLLISIFITTVLLKTGLSIFILIYYQVPNAISADINAHDLGLEVFPSLVNLLIFVTGFVRNVYVIADVSIIHGSPSNMRHSVSNIFLTNLAVADLIVSLLCVPLMLTLTVSFLHFSSFYGFRI